MCEIHFSERKAKAKKKEKLYMLRGKEGKLRGKRRDLKGKVLERGGTQMCVILK